MKTIIVLLMLFFGLSMAMPVTGEGLSPPYGVEINELGYVSPEVDATMPSPIANSQSFNVMTNEYSILSLTATIAVTRLQERGAIGLLKDYYPFIPSL